MFQTGHSVENIATRIKYSRAHLQKILTGKEKGKGKDDVLGKLKGAYQEEITQFVQKYSKFPNSEKQDRRPSQVPLLTEAVIEELFLTVKNIEKRINQVFPEGTGSLFDEVQRLISDKGSGSKKGK